MRALLAALLLLGGCSFVTLEPPCDDDSNCPFARVCVDGACRAPDAGTPAGEGEGEPAAIECTDVVDVAGDLVLPGDEAALASTGTTCVRATGDVDVGAVATLAALARVQEIVGSLQVRGSALRDFEGANVLAAVGGVLTVRENLSLESFAGLEALTSVGDVDVRDNGPGLDEAEVDALLTQLGR